MSGHPPFRASTPRALLVGRRSERWVHVRRALQRAGYEVNEVSSGAAALGMVEVMPADEVRVVVLLPTGLGLKTGALARRLHELRPKLRVVVASGRLGSHQPLFPLIVKLRTSG